MNSYIWQLGIRKNRPNTPSPRGEGEELASKSRGHSSMLRNQLIQLVHYNQWANTKLVGFLQKLEPALLDKEIPSSFNTIRKTVYHIWDAEYLWYKRLKGISLRDWPSKNFQGSDAEVFNEFIGQSSMFIGYVEDRNEDELLAEITYRSIDGKEHTNTIADIIQHAMNHSTFHRGQLVTMLRNAGFTEFSSTDLITFVREKKSKYI